MIFSRKAIKVTDIISAAVDLISALSAPAINEPTRKIVDLLGMQDPPTRLYTRHEIESKHLTCLGANKKDGIAVYVELPDVYTHTLTIGKTGIGKTTFFCASYLDRFISYYPEASVVFVDAMDGVIDEVIARCKKIRRKYIVLPDDGMSLLNCSCNPYEVGDKLGQIYMQTYGTIEGDSSHYHRLIKDFLLYAIPLFYASYGRMPVFQEVMSMAREKNVMQWTLEDAPLDSYERQEYEMEFEGKHDKEKLHSLRLFIHEITSGKRAYMLNQKDAKSLDSLINDPERPVILLRVGDFKGSVKYTLGVLAVSMISSFVTNRDMRISNHPCLFYIDEAGLMTSSASSTPDMLSSMLHTARKKNCGFVLGMQSLGQIPEVYRETFLNGCNTAILHPDLDSTTATHFADQIGNVTWEITYISETVDADGRKRNQVSRERKPDYYITPAEIMNMAKDEVIVLKRHDFAKRTPLRLIKPNKYEYDIEHYTEPDVPTRAPQTIWEERGYKQSRPLSKDKKNQTKEQALKEAEDMIKGLNNRKGRSGK